MDKSIEFLQDMFPIDHQIIYETYVSKNKNIDETISTLINFCNSGTRYPPSYEEAMLNPSKSPSNTNENSKRKDSRRNLGKKEWKPPMVGKLPDDFLRVPNEISNNSSSIGIICKSCSKLNLKHVKSDCNSTHGGVPNSSLTASEVENIDLIIRRRMENNVSQTRFATMRTTPDLDSIQYLDDERLALMLQNQEFLKLIQSDPEFQQALKEDHKASTSEISDQDMEDIWRERDESVRFRPQSMDLDYGYEQSDIVDPDHLWSQPHNPSAENDVTKMYKALGKASRNRINSLARKFLSIRRRKSSRSYVNIDGSMERENKSDSNRWETESTQQLITTDNDSDDWVDLTSNYAHTMSSMHRADSNSTLI